MRNLQNHSGWLPIYKDSSLPYMEGDKFLVRRNECSGGCVYGSIAKCHKSRPCVSMLRCHRVGTIYADPKHQTDVKYWVNDNCSITYSRSYIILKFREFYIIQLGFYRLYPEDEKQD